MSLKSEDKKVEIFKKQRANRNTVTKLILV